MAKNCFIAAAGLVWSVIVLTPAQAAIQYTAANVSRTYFQFAEPTSLTAGYFGGAARIAFSVGVSDADEFDSATILFPGAEQPVAVPFNLRLQGNGAYQSDAAYGPFESIAALNSQFPFGRYTYTLTDSVTGATQSSALIYDSNHWPSAVPALTNYNAVQGLRASQGGVFTFDGFTGDGFWPYGGTDPETIDPFTILAIFDGSTPVYRSPRLTATTTSFALPSEVLDPSTTYTYQLQYGNTLHLPNPDDPSGPGYALSFSEVTFGNFVTAAEDQFTRTLVDFEGGTLENPQELPVTGRIGSISGSIGGVGDQDFYEIFWEGGFFAANVNLTGADPTNSFHFQLYDDGQDLLSDQLLNFDNDYSGTITGFIDRGRYLVGLYSDGDLDPFFTINFITPVGAPVPEPSAWAMMIGGATLTGGVMRSRRRRGQAASA